MANESLHTSQAGLDFITKEEGIVLRPYKDGTGFSIGVGHFMSDAEKKSFANGITKEQAMELFKNDIVKFENFIKQYIKVELNQDQFDALVSLIYNTGPAPIINGNLGKVINSGDFYKVPHEMSRWNRSENKINPVLEGRRSREIALFQGSSDNKEKNVSNIAILHPKDKADPSYLKQVEDLFDSYLQLVATVKQDNKILKKSNLKKLDKNIISINIKSSDLINSIEFARILCLALDEEVQADTYTATDGKNVEVNCIIYGPNDLCIKSVAQLSQSLENVFEFATKKIGGIKVKTDIIPNKTANYKILDIDLAQSAYRRFHYQFI